jgi:RND family efflux transporter MFP subunit
MHTPVRRVLSGAALFGALALGLAGCKVGAPPPAEPPPAKVTVARPVMTPVQDFNEYNGHLEAVEMVEVKARVKGLLQEVYFKEGEEIAAGAKLYLIDPREYKTAVARSKADIAKAEGDLNNWKAKSDLAKKNVERLKALAGASQLERDEAQSAYDVNVAMVQVAEATKDAAEAALQTANIQLGYTDIRAPIAGRINRTLVTKGNLVGQDQPTLLTTIVSVDPMYVYFDTPERDLIEYQRAQRAQPSGQATRAIEVGITSEEGHPHKGVIDFRENRVDVGTGTVRLRGRLPNPPAPTTGVRLLYPGLYARVRVPSGPPQPRPVIPEDAIMTGQEGRFVYVVGPENAVEKRVVTVGTKVWQMPPPGEAAPPGWALLNPNPAPAPPGAPPAPARQPLRSVVAIVRGLEPTDRVIVVGVQKAQPGRKVAPEDWEIRQPGETKTAQK